MKYRTMILHSILAIFLAWSFAITPQSVYAAKTKAKVTNKASSNPTIKVQDTKSFFSWYIRNGDIERSEFETEEEYRKRFPWFDCNKVIYFKVTNGLLDSDFIDFNYNIDMQELTCKAGSPWDVMNVMDVELAKGTRVIIKTDYQRIRTYTGENAFGATVTVKETESNDYVLNFLNMDKCPDATFDRDEKKLKISITRPPKEAERLSKKLEMIIGVKLPGHERSDSLVKYREPTIDHPYGSTNYAHVIDATLVKVILRDKFSKVIIAEASVK